MSSIDFLKKVPLFNDLTVEELKLLSSIIKEVSFSAGSEIIREDETGEEMYILKEGTVDVSKTLTMKIARGEFGQKEKSFIRLSGENRAFFGEMGMLEKNLRSATVTAVSDCKLCIIKKKDFEAFCEKQPTIGYRIVRALACIVSSRLRKTNEDVLKLTTALSLALEK